MLRISFNTARSAAVWTRCVRCLSASMSLGELNQPMAKNHIIVTATGADRPGVMNDIAKLIVRHGGDVTESKMSRMGGDVSIMMRVNVPQLHVKMIDSHLTYLEGMRCYIHPASECLLEAEEPLFKASFRAQGRTNRDLLVDFTKVFREYGLKMEQLETKTVCDSSLGTDSEYIMEGELTAQDSVDVGSLEADLNKLGRLHNVSVELDHFVEFGCSLER